MATIRGGDKQRAHLAALGRKIGDHISQVNVGFLAGARYPGLGGTTVAMVAAIQEYGAPRAGVPSRSYFRSMVLKRKASWGSELRTILITADYDVPRTLSLMGEVMKGQLQQSIVDLFHPQLSPVTLMLRKMRKKNPDLVVTGKVVGEAARRVAAGENYGGVSTKPLIDSGFLLHSVDWQLT